MAANGLAPNGARPSAGMVLILILDMIIYISCESFSI